MDKIFACIKNDKIENVIVADDAFVKAIAPNWDFVIRVDELDPAPGIGWSYDGEDFAPPQVQEL